MSCNNTQKNSRLLTQLEKCQQWRKSGKTGCQISTCLSRMPSWSTFVIPGTCLSTGIQQSPRLPPTSKSSLALTCISIGTTPTLEWGLADTCSANTSLASWIKTECGLQTLLSRNLTKSWTDPCSRSPESGCLSTPRRDSCLAISLQLLTWVWLVKSLIARPSTCHSKTSTLQSTNGCTRRWWTYLTSSEFRIWAH